MSIDPQDITFVTQGSLKPPSLSVNYEDYLPENYAAKTIASLRKFCPQAKIILSTWRGEDASELNADEIIYNQDPGAFPYSCAADSALNNVNRQITATASGLKKVKTKYVFKLRTDFCLTGKNFLRYFAAYNKYEADYKIVKQRLLACAFVTRNPEGLYPYPFHLSDFAFFGLTADLRDLFDIPLMSKAEQVWFRKHPVASNRQQFLCRYVPEQYLMLNFLRKHKRPAHCRHIFDATPQSIAETRHYLANNFVLLSFEQFSLRPQKPKLQPETVPNFSSCYTHLDWLKMYKEFCDYSLKLPRQDKYTLHVRKMRRLDNFLEFLLNGLLFLT
ncbi:MAG: WavE lipopolysaccharide synthesis family protein, partial [Candidatus Margulisbacteria bacterium]|nr:WavE lipopolysaccharide synthesis family protein [Candidatus Margulisiibacteriota bacterium]